MRMGRIQWVYLPAIALVLLGCAGDRSRTPIDPSPGAPELQRPIFLSARTPFSPVPQGEIEESRFIKARDGGELSVAGARVKFPKGALPSDMTLTLRVTPGEAVHLRVEPAGVALLLPAIVQLDDVRRTDHRRHARPSFVLLGGASPAALATIYDGDHIRGQASLTGEYVLAGLAADGQVLQFISYLSGEGYLTKLIEADRGGEVRYDRVKVRIPAGALTEDTYITVRQLGDGYLAAELEPHGIAFQVPVNLEIDLDDLEYEPYFDWSIWWLNDGTGLWENQGGIFADEKVTAQLWHFSEYAPGRGRAGW